MKDNRIYHLPCKIAALLSAVLLWSLTLLLGTGLLYVTLLAGSENTAEAACQGAVSRYESAYLRNILDEVNYTADSRFLHDRLDGENYYATITVNGKTVFDNYQNESYRATRTQNELITDDEGNETAISVVMYLKTEPTKQDFYAVTLRTVSWLFNNRPWCALLCLLGLILSLALTVWVCCVTARRADNPETAVCCFFGRLPTDLSALAVGLCVIGLISLAESMTYSNFEVAFAPALLFPAACLLVYCIADIAARVKTRTFWQNTLIRRLCRTLAHGIAALPLIPKTVGAVLLFLFAELIGILLLADRPRALFSVWIAEKLLLVPLTLWFFSGLRRVREGIVCIADGKLNAHLPTKGLPGDVKAAADDLNRIDEGLQKAVEDRLKSERLRTELITNVSHDIKTPLTSIISYVDLIKKEEPENEQIKAYIDVLDRQSIRLKKLIEDLVEASKASTGNLTVDLSPCDLGTMLTQTIGEYTERFEHAGLTPVLHLPKEPIVISADSRHLWRIFDNLMNNICKYALSGTRVYFDLLKNGNQAICIFRNISRSELTVSPDELSERFVRGDSSRNTEGSGLGLSIAASLTALQKGRLDISTDGDLFKVILTFSALNDEKG